LRIITKRPCDEFVSVGVVKDLFVLLFHSVASHEKISDAIEQLDKENEENEKVNR
jgi:hypothetical protein